MNINNRTRRVWLGVVLGGGLFAAVATASTAMASEGADPGVKPSGVASVATAKPSGVESVSTQKPSGIESVTTVKPSGSPSSWTSQPADDTAPVEANKFITTTGTFQAGVESGCMILNADNGKHYQLLGADPTKVPANRRVRVSGYLRPDVLTTCQQGTPLFVTSMGPA